MQGKLEMVQL